MKRLTALLLTVCLSVALTACGGGTDPGKPADSPPADTQSAPAPSEDVPGAPAPTQSPAKVWSEPELLSLFTAGGTLEEAVVGCVRTDDLAYGWIGVVLFVDGEDGKVNVAYVNEGGGYSLCALPVRSAVPVQLRYHGDGAVTFMAETEEGFLHEYQITYTRSEDGRFTSIDVASDPLNGEPNSN